MQALLRPYAPTTKKSSSSQACRASKTGVAHLSQKKECRSLPKIGYTIPRRLCHRFVLLRCESIGKSYGVKPLFTDLPIGLCDGDHVGLIGPNGSGKSTLLKILVGLDEPNSSTRSVQRQVEWLRRGPNVRTTKAKARIDSAGRLVDELLDMGRDLGFPGGQLFVQFLSDLRHGISPPSPGVPCNGTPFCAPSCSVPIGVSSSSPTTLMGTSLAFSIRRGIPVSLSTSLAVWHNL